MEVGTQTWKGSVGTFLFRFSSWCSQNESYNNFRTLLSNCNTLIITTEYEIESLFLPICSQVSEILILLMQAGRSLLTLCYSIPTAIYNNKQQF